MSVRMKVSRAKTGSRRAHHALVGPRLTNDVESGEPRLRHRASPITGRYRGRVVIDMAAQIAKREEKRKVREREAVRMGESVKEEKVADEEKPVSAPKQAPLDAAKLSSREQ
ncbi:MAG TPA: 50S ribosomal protein L32 [Candidatus Paceibacterota bacterium]